METKEKAIKIITTACTIIATLLLVIQFIKDNEMKTAIWNNIELIILIICVLVTLFVFVYYKIKNLLKEETTKIETKLNNHIKGYTDANEMT